MIHYHSIRIQTTE